MQIGQWLFTSRVFVAPMERVKDFPFRQLCKRLDAGYAVYEMAVSNPKLWNSVKMPCCLNHDSEMAPISVKIAGADMGCLDKKVCNLASGLTLLHQKNLIFHILDAVVLACASLGVLVTLETRTCSDRNSCTVLRVTKIAQNASISALSSHGLIRTDLYTTGAEYDTIWAIQADLTIPVMANDDVNSPQKAKYILDYTGANAIMIDRAVQKRVWIFREIDHYLRMGTTLALPSSEEMRNLLLKHLDNHYQFYASTRAYEPQAMAGGRSMVQRTLSGNGPLQAAAVARLSHNGLSAANVNITELLQENEQARCFGRMRTHQLGALLRRFG